MTSMTTRRTYKKSTRGCTTCKSRRVKCDEKRPSCSNCARRQNTCTYTTEMLPFDSHITASPNFQSLLGIAGDTATIMAHPLESRKNDSRLLEMRLISHCAMVTFNSVASIKDAARSTAWSTEIFNLAFQSDPENPLLDILLGLSASHLYLLNPNDQMLKSASHHYHGRGLQKCNELMPRINDVSCPSLFASSILIALHLLLLRKMRLEESYEVPVAWFHALKGVNTIVSVNRSWITNSKLTPLLLDVQASNVVDETENLGIFGNLLTTLTLRVDQKHIAVYKYAVDYLNLLHRSYETSQGDDLNAFRQSLLAFPGKIPSLLLSLLEQHDPGALVITAHFFGLLKIIEKDIWWLEGVPKREIEGILTLVPIDWFWAMNWPVEQICDL